MSLLNRRDFLKAGLTDGTLLLHTAVWAKPLPPEHPPGHLARDGFLAPGCGHKVNNGVINFVPDGGPCTPIMHLARAAGLGTGLSAPPQCDGRALF